MNINSKIFIAAVLLVCGAIGCSTSRTEATHSRGTLTMSRTEYRDRVEAIWTAQIIAATMGFQFEHKVASTKWVDQYPEKMDHAEVDDDWYYEMCAVRGFEKYGIGMTVEQLGQQWLENKCGSWGSSEQARLLLARGIKAPDTGHPRYNALWFTIGPQFSSDLYGALAPGQPNLAGALARKYGHVNGYAEGVDGAVFVAGMISLGFCETNTHLIVKQAATLIHPDSPYRKCLDQVIALAEAGRTPEEIANAIEGRWRVEYPASNNAVPNGAIVALGVWFGEGDFLKTVNIIYRAADFTDADCNAANAASVIAAMHGMKGLPKHLVEPLHDRIAGSELGPVKITPPVDEKISTLAARTAKISEAMLLANGAHLNGVTLEISRQEPVTQAAELFSVGELTKYWNADWTLERAGLGGGSGGIGGIRGNTHLEEDVLATYPRDPARGLVLRRNLKLGNDAVLTLEAGADGKRAWDLEIYCGNKMLLRRRIDGGVNAKPEERHWESIRVDLKEFAGQEVQLRLYQRVLLPNRVPGNAYWRNLKVE